MPKSLVVLSFFVLLLGGCTKETYLQAVPCENCDCEEEVCEELIPQTEKLYFEVYDGPALPVRYNPCPEPVRPNCKTVCRVVQH